MVKLANAGFKVVPVCDGTRPVCKQATNYRAAKREKLRIDAYRLRTEVMAQQRALNMNIRLTSEECSRIQHEIDQKEIQMKSKETQDRTKL